MDFGIVVADVITYLETTVTGFAAVFALVIGVATGLGIVKKFIRTR